MDASLLTADIMGPIQFALTEVVGGIMLNGLGSIGFYLILLVISAVLTGAVWKIVCSVPQFINLIQITTYAPLDS
jgi:hypothetical protein